MRVKNTCEDKGMATGRLPSCSFHKRTHISEWTQFT